MNGKVKIIAFTVIITLLVYGCEKNYIAPFDIFKTETLTDTSRVNLGNAAGLDTLYVNADRIEATENGYHIKGSLFSKSLSGIIPVTNGDFTINSNIAASASTLKSALASGISSFEFSGYGTADFPHVGMLKDIETGDVPGSETYYNSGRIFKVESNISSLPLLDDRYYFRYKIDNPKKGKEFNLKNITFKLREFYLDAHDPATIFYGDLYSKNKTGIKRLVAEQVVLGLSANELWKFTPYTFSKRLEDVVGGTGFKPMNGGIYLSGLVPLKKYPLKVFGQAVINTSFSSMGNLDFFERGFDDASFQIGVNGTVLFDSKFIPFLTGIDSVSLGKATMMAELGDDGNAVRVAGEYSGDYLHQFLGDDVLKFVPYNENQGIMYLRCDENPDDLILYLEENIHLSVPGLGETEIASSIFKVTKNGLELSGSIHLPYDIGDVDVVGNFNTDGSFLLKGTAKSKVTLGDGQSFNATLNVEVSDNGVSLRGTVDLPYNIGNVDVQGKLTTTELALSGIINSNIDFKGVKLQGNLEVQISSVSGIKLAGKVDLPAGIGKIDVSGEITSQRIALSGKIGSGISIKLLNVKVTTSSTMALTLSSETGVKFTGNVSLPFNFGNASVVGEVTTGGGVTISGNLNSSVYGLSTSMKLNASTSISGIRLNGSMKFPGNFGWVSMSGIMTSSSYDLTGKTTIGGVSLISLCSVDINFSFDVSDSGVSAEGSSSFSIAGASHCFDVSVHDILTGNPRICTSIDLLVYSFDGCADFW